MHVSNVMTHRWCIHLGVILRCIPHSGVPMIRPRPGNGEEKSEVENLVYSPFYCSFSDIFYGRPKRAVNVYGEWKGSHHSNQFKSKINKSLAHSHNSNMCWSFFLPFYRFPFIFTLKMWIAVRDPQMSSKITFKITVKAKTLLHEVFVVSFDGNAINLYILIHLNIYLLILD